MRPRDELEREVDGWPRAVRRSLGERRRPPILPASPRQPRPQVCYALRFRRRPPSDPASSPRCTCATCARPTTPACRRSRASRWTCSRAISSRCSAPTAPASRTLIGIVSSLVNKSCGEVRIFGVDLAADRSAAMRLIGLVPQEMNFNLFEKPFDILRQLRRFLRHAARRGAGARRRGTEARAAVGQGAAACRARCRAA